MILIAKILNKIATYLPIDYSRVIAGIAKCLRPTEWIPDLDEMITLLYYRFPFFRNKFRSVKLDFFNDQVNSNSKYFNFDFNREAVKGIRDNGLKTGFTLKDEYLKDIRDELSNVPMDWDGNTIRKDFSEIESMDKNEFKIAQAHYLDLTTNPLLLKMATEPAILNFASEYLKSADLNIDIFSWWNFPIKKENIESDYQKDYNFGQEFHFDHTSRRMLKVFVYLTDCDEDSGPHVFIEKTHIDKPFMISLRQKNLTEEGMEKYIPKSDRWKVIKGDKGASFLVDHFGMHRGENPKEKQRLVLQFMYSVNPLGLKNFSTYVNVPRYIRSNIHSYQEVQPPSTAKSVPVT